MPDPTIIHWMGPKNDTQAIFTGVDLNAVTWIVNRPPRVGEIGKAQILPRLNVNPLEIPPDARL